MNEVQLQIQVSLQSLMLLSAVETETYTAPNFTEIFTKHVCPQNNVYAVVKNCRFKYENTIMCYFEPGSHVSIGYRMTFTTDCLTACVMCCSVVRSQQSL